ncbi:MAG: hypothetical protein ACWA42_06165 [Lutibacter sp.]
MRELISKRKPAFPINNLLYDYLSTYNRNIKIPIFYEDLLRFDGAVSVYDKHGEDTLWIRVYYSEHERDEIDLSLKKMYMILHGDGTEDTLPFLTVDAIDYCTFGNSKPFRVKIRNILNDNYSYIYVKIADASRVYGLELEHILSPNNINFLIYKDTLIEEHVLGIPGDVFLEENLKYVTENGLKRLSKEFVKFNERCMIRLLGDMRAYNFVIVASYDFDRVEYRIRAMDFDQQSFEGNLKVYMPQFFKDNFPYVKMVSENLQEESIEQYRKEERSAIARRLRGAQYRIDRLLTCLEHDTISTKEKVNQLKQDLFKFTKDVKFKKCDSMGMILRTGFDFVVRNYENVNAYIIHKDKD